MQKVFLLGNIGKDAIVSSDGKRVDFSLACKGYKSESVTWYSCGYFGSAKIAEHLKKGRQILVTGELNANLKDGKMYLNIHVTGIEFTSNEKKGETNA